MLLGISVVLAAAESLLDGIFPFSGLIAVMSMGIAAKQSFPRLSQRYLSLPRSAHSALI